MDSKDSIYTGIGMVIVAFSSIEREMVALAYNLSETKLAVTTMVAPMLGFKHYVNLLENIINEKVKDQQSIDKFADILKKLRQAEEKRNQIVHSMWFINPPGGIWHDRAVALKFIARRKNNKLGRVITGYDYKQLETLANEWETLAREMDMMTGYIQKKKIPLR